MAEIVMPRLSDSMEEGTIVRWLKRDGDEVARGEELVEIETDKATMAYESDTAGTLSISATEGTTLPVGAMIATIGDGSDAPSGRPQPSFQPLLQSRSKNRTKRWLSRSSRPPNQASVSRPLR